jgi:hypothetical protein
MSDLSAVFPQLEVLKGCSVQQARELGISKAKLWDVAMEALRLHGRFDDDQLIDIIWTAAEQLEDRVGAENAFGLAEQLVSEINALPVEPEPEHMDGAYL